MATFFKAHRIAATVVLVVAAAWVATGEFSAVGSQEAKASEPGSPAADASVSGTVAPAPLRTVAAVVPVFADHAREIRISGATSADKSAVLAARSDGIVETLVRHEGHGDGGLVKIRVAENGI